MPNNRRQIFIPPVVNLEEENLITQSLQKLVKNIKEASEASIKKEEIESFFEVTMNHYNTYIQSLNSYKTTEHWQKDEIKKHIIEFLSQPNNCKNEQDLKRQLNDLEKDKILLSNATKVVEKTPIEDNYQESKARITEALALAKEVIQRKEQRLIKNNPNFLYQLYRQSTNGYEQKAATISANGGRF